MNYSSEEKESVFLYDYHEQVWKVTTNVPKHMNRLMKVTDDYRVVDTFIDIHGVERPSMIEARLPKSAITIRDYQGKGKRKNELRKNEERDSD